MNTGAQMAGLGHNGAPFDFFEFIDTVLATSASAAEKLIAIVHGRQIARKNGESYLSRSRAQTAASVSDNTYQRALPVVRLFLQDVSSRGRATTWKQRSDITTESVEEAILALRNTPEVRPKSIPQNGASSRGIPQNGVAPYPKMVGHKELFKDEVERPNGLLSSALPNDAPRPSAIAKEAFSAFNETAQRCGLPLAKAYTKARATALYHRVKEAGGMDGFRAALANLEKSAFLQGNNDRGWKADLDFVCQPRSFAKLMDGGFGNGAHAMKSEVKPADMPDFIWERAQRAKREALS